ncbi:22804_t:CDS:2, partial [Dentiscutata erythropus]
LVLKEFILIYQSWTILSNALIIEKAKLLASELKIPEGKLQFSQGWLQKFKKRNRIRQRILHGEEASADQNAIIKSLLLLRDICARYSFNRIYNMDETVPPNDQIIKELAYTFKKDESVDKNIIEVDDEDDSVEIIAVSGSLALNNLENIHMFLLQQEGS